MCSKFYTYIISILQFHGRKLERECTDNIKIYRTWKMPLLYWLPRQGYLNQMGKHRMCIQNTPKFSKSDELKEEESKKYNKIEAEDHE